MRTHSGQPLRETAGPIRNIDDLRRVATILARHFDLPRAPTVKVGYVPWKGPSTSLVDSPGIPLGHFTIARWAVRDKFRRAPDDLEYQLVCAVGSCWTVIGGIPATKRIAQACSMKRVPARSLSHGTVQTPRLRSSRLALGTGASRSGYS